MKTARYTALLLILAASLLVFLIYSNLPPSRELPTTSPTPVSQKSWFKFSLFGKPKVVILAAGDVMLGRTVMTKSLDLGDPRYPFARVAEKLWKADLTLVNLEAPFVTGCPRSSAGLIFCADPRMIEGLTFAGIDVVSLDNNHIRNYGQKGLEETKKLLVQNGVEATGLGNLVVKRIAGTNFGFLGFNFVDRRPTTADYQLVADAKKKVDVLLLTVHWGAEYSVQPSSSQRQWAKDLVGAGADIIIGHHSHWVQEMEEIGGKPVYYSLGNFVFDQMWSEKTREGMVAEFTFRGSRLVSRQTSKIYMANWAQPEFK